MLDCYRTRARIRAGAVCEVGPMVGPVMVTSFGTGASSQRNAMSLVSGDSKTKTHNAFASRFRNRSQKDRRLNFWDCSGGVCLCFFRLLVAETLYREATTTR